MFKDKTLLPPLLDAYLRSLKRRQSLSRYTLLNYELDLRSFMEFIQKTRGKPSVERLMNRELYKGYLDLLTRAYSPATVRRRFSAIRGWIKYLHRSGYIDSNPARGFEFDAKDTSDYEPFSETEVARFLNHLNSRTLREKRVRAVAELIYASGLLISEVVSLDRKDVDLERGVLMIRGSSPRTLGMNNACRKAMLDYVTSLSIHPHENNSQKFFTNLSGEGVSARSLQRDLKEAAIKMLGKRGEELTARRLREACACHLYDRGAGLSDLRRLLGHRSVLAGQKYATPRFERIEDEYRKAHPSEKIRSTTILCLHHRGQMVVAGDGQVTMGATVIKDSAKKVRRLYQGKVVAGFAGSTADAFTLFERFEKKLEKHNGDLVRSAVELAKDWRTDRHLRKLEALMIVANRENQLILSGSGDVIEPDEGVSAIGSGAPYARAAALALMRHSDLGAEAVAKQSMGIAAQMCVYTNGELTLELL